MKRYECTLLFAILFLYSTGFASAQKVQFVNSPEKIDVIIGSNYITSYLFEDKIKKPILFPVCSPSGEVLTRGYPLETRKGESDDHPHHTGMFFTYGDVNSEDFWSNGTGNCRIKHVKVLSSEATEEEGILSTLSHWISEDSSVVLEEKRTMTFAGLENGYTIDLNIELAAQEKKVVFKDTKEGMFGFRVADWLSEENGKGKYLSSRGDKKEKKVWGKRAEWVRLEGKKDSKVYGIAIFNHPDSVNYPTYWHARGYGLFSANPLGQGVFMQTRKERNPKSLDLILEPGEKATFRFLVSIYEGSRTKEELDGAFVKYTGDKSSNKSEEK